MKSPTDRSDSNYDSNDWCLRMSNWVGTKQNKIVLWKLWHSCAQSVSQFSQHIYFCPHWSTLWSTAVTVTQMCTVVSQIPNCAQLRRSREKNDHMGTFRYRWCLLQTWSTNNWRHAHTQFNLLSLFHSVSSSISIVGQQKIISKLVVSTSIAALPPHYRNIK